MRKWPSAVFRPSGHLYLNAVHKDGLGLIQTISTTTVHSSCNLVDYCKLRIMRKPFLSLRWVAQVPYLAYQVRGQVSPIRTLRYLFYLSTWGRMWCVPRLVMWFVMVEEIMYRVYPLLGTWITITLVGQVSSVALYYEQPNLPCGEIISNHNHLFQFFTRNKSYLFPCV